MFKLLFGGSRSPDPEVWAAIEHLALSKAPVRVEIENSLERFMSQLAIKDGSVFVSRPSRPTLDLTPGAHIRALIPGDEKRELRLEIVVSRMAYGKNKTAFLCKPSRRQNPTRRRDDRYSVRRYSNLRLALDGEQFRVVDVSASGCKLLLTPQQKEIAFPIGQTIPFADLSVGSRVNIKLERVIPRSRNGRSVGTEFTIRRDGTSGEYLERLLASLDKKEQDRRIM